MSEMVERVARAMFKASEPVSNWDDMGERYHAQWRTEARAAIEAMREPPLNIRVLTAEVESAVKSAGLAPGRVARDVWRAMIDEALK